jgi:hypothetical protein
MPAQEWDYEKQEKPTGSRGKKISDEKGKPTE